MSIPRAWICLVGFLFLFASGCKQKEEKPQPPSAPGKVATPPSAEPQTISPPVQEASSEVPTSAKVKHDKTRDAAAILDAAIKARGGLAVLKTASSWTSQWKGISKGTPHTGKMIKSNGEVRRDFTTPDGQPVVTVRAAEACWNRIGDNAGRCSPAEEKLCQQGLAMNRAAMLWPLKDKGWELLAGTLQHGDKKYDTLRARSAEFKTTAILVFDPQTGLMDYCILADISIGGQTGDLVAHILERGQACGTSMSTRTRLTFMGREIGLNQNSEIRCEPVDPQVFAYSEAE